MKKNNVIKWFWEIINEEIVKGRKDIIIKLFEFTTGTCRSNIKIKKEIIPQKFSIMFKEEYNVEQDNLPISSTCQQRLTFHNYPNIKTMREKLFTAIYQPRELSKTIADD